MKKVLSTLFLLTAIVAASFAQELRINTYAGYVFKDKIDSYYSSTSYFEGQIQDGLRWGAGIEYHIPNRGAVEIQYLRQDTNVPTVYLDGFFGGQVQETDFDMAINWLMLNGTRYFPVNDIVEPFAGAGFGMGIFNVSNPAGNGDGTSGTKFAWNIRGGSNFWVADNIAIRIQASLFSATQAIGGGLYFGSGGYGGGLSSYSSMYQFGLEGGLVFRLLNAGK